MQSEKCLCEISLTQVNDPAGINNGTYYFSGAIKFISPQCTGPQPRALQNVQVQVQTQVSMLADKDLKFSLTFKFISGVHDTEQV